MEKKINEEKASKRLQKMLISKRRSSQISKSVVKYQRKAYKSYSVRIRKDSMQDIIKHLDSQENVAQYIIGLIKKDML